MAFFSATLSFHSFSPLSPLHLHFQTKAPISTSSISIPRANAAEPDKETIVQKSDEEPPKPKPPSSTTARPKKPVYSLKKGQIVRVDKEKYLSSVNAMYRDLTDVNWIQEVILGALNKRVFSLRCICLLGIHLISKVWTTFMKTAVRSWTYVYLRQENTHSLHGLESRLHLHGSQPICLLSLISLIMRGSD